MYRRARDVEHAEVLGIVLARQHVGTFVALDNATDLRDLRELIKAGTVTPSVDPTYPLTAVPAAIRQLLDGRARGKLVVSIAPPTLLTQGKPHDRSANALSHPRRRGAGVWAGD